MTDAPPPPLPPPPPPYPQSSAGLEYARRAGPDKPRVITWFATYAVLMALIYLFALGLGLAFIIWPDQWVTEQHETPRVVRFQGVAIAVIAVPLLAAFAAAPMLPRRRWVWVYDLVMICVGLTSCCFWPISIPLLIHWIKPEAKSWFGRGA